MAIKFNRSQTFATGGTVTAADLHNLIDGTDIYPALITDQGNLATISTDDKLLIADTDDAINAKSTTVQNLFDDALSSGTYTNAAISGQFSYGTATGNRTVTTSATITTGTIQNLTIGTTTSTAASITSGTIPTLTTGTTNSTAANITNGTIQTLTASTATITGGTIGNLSSTLVGDFTISQGTGTLGTSGVTSGTYGGSSSIPTIVVDAKGRVTTASTSSITTGYTGFRNRIINGDMRIDQRNAGASQSIAAASPSYTVDRWIVRPTGGTVTGQRVAGTGATQYVYQITGGASVTQLQFEQRIEASNSYDLAGSNVTISANISNSLLTTANWILYYANSTDNFSANTLISSGNWTVSSTISRYSATVAIPSAATTGLYLIIYVGAQTSGTFVIGNVQLEAGSTATDFERRPYGTELALCQRYYQGNLSNGSEGVSGNAIFRGNSATASGTFYYWMTFPVTMRAAPTMNIGTPIYSNASGASFANSKVSGAEILFTVSSGGGYVFTNWRAEIEL